ncbi:MAG TPA: hypothetical protein VIT65_13895 [Microlunatus sp.]
MSLLFIDGFDAGDFATKYTTIGSGAGTTATTRFSTGLSFYYSGAAGGSTLLRKDFAASAKVVLGFAYRASGFNDSQPLLAFYGDAGATPHTGLRIMASGAVALYRSSTQIAISAAGVCQANAWHYIEMSATVSDTVGVVTAKVDGTQVVTFTGDTKNAGTATTLDRVDFLNSAGLMYFDDLYLCDGLGAAPWNDFLGDMRVQTIRPTAAGSQTDLTPVGSANNWDTVNESPPSITDYNYSATVGARDLYAMGDIAAATNGVLGVQLVSVAHKTDSATRSVKNLVKVGSTVYASAAKVLAVSATPTLTVHQVNPATSAAWTVSEVNAIETGVEVA